MTNFWKMRKPSGYGSVRTASKSAKAHRKKRIKRLHKDVPRTKYQKIKWGKAEKVQKGVYESAYRYGGY